MTTITPEKLKNLFPAMSAVPEHLRLSEPIVQREYLVGGQLRPWDGALEDGYSPIYLETEAGLEQQFIGSYPMLGEAEALEALDAAVAAYDHGQGEWATMSVEDRIHAIQTFACLMQEEKDTIVKLLMWEIAKSYKDAEKEFDRTIAYIDDTIDAFKNLDRVSSHFEVVQGIIAQVRRVPLGVVLCMGPSNYPLNETFATLIPALIMGNTVVIKFPRPGTLLNYPLLKAFQKAFPAGVINTVYGRGREIIPPLMSSGKVDSIAFIGASHAADTLKKQHPKTNRLRAIFGLDAKNPGIILPDADIDLAVQECLLGTLSYNGQRCTALKILFVHESITDTFIKRFVEKLEALKFGMPWEEGVTVTPVLAEERVSYFNELVEDATQHGAKIINPSGGMTHKTFFYPAALYPVTDAMRVYHEEQFGPVIPIVSFSTIDEPIKHIVNSQYGQQASIFGTDPATVTPLMDILVRQVCRVNLNSQCQRGPDVFPFTGRKDSALGTLSVTDALRSFSIRTLVAAKENQTNKTLVTTIVRERMSNFLSTDFIL